ncbi:Tox-REase-5 domain-containing protein [Haliangium sp.]|uniref:Tox-REase-5 domain-containing protein n=1 Tax=Haliangium sp. TaxID=2663208 RepID=UPI003D149C4C
MSACNNSRFEKLDELALNEQAVCDALFEGGAFELNGRYEEQGVSLDYERLVPMPAPKSGSQAEQAARVVLGDAAKLEQLYSDAAAGSLRARWLVCTFEVAARSMGRQLARYAMGLDCQMLWQCEVDIEALPLSADTASGARLLNQIAISFVDLSEELGVRLELIASLLELMVGVRVAGGVFAGRPRLAAARRRAKLERQRATAAAGAGPGRWVRVNEHMPPRARAYQERITGRSADEAYEVGGVKFDGYRDGVLLEAKGPGYAKFTKDGDFRGFFEGQHGLFEQAQRQIRVAGRYPIEWHVAEGDFARLLTEQFSRMSVRGIVVVHTP